MKFPYQRVLVLGNGGAGKSTFARAMGERFSLPVVHLDRIWWLPGWVNRSREEFDELLGRELDAPAWVMDGNYERTLSWRLCYAEAAVFLDLPAEECLKSVRARAEEYRGRTRPDMTEGCEERLDEEFETWIGTYAEETRGKVLRAVQASGVPLFVFPSREGAWAWLEGFDRQ